MKQTKETFCSYTAELDGCDSTSQKKEEEVVNAEGREILQHKLEILKGRLERSKKSQQVQKLRYHRFIALFVSKYRTKEREVKTHLELKHNQLTALLRALYVLESKLKKEQKFFWALLKQKDAIIEEQRREIKKLLRKQFYDDCNNDGGGKRTTIVTAADKSGGEVVIDNKPDLISGITTDDYRNHHHQQHPMMLANYRDNDNSRRISLPIEQDACLIEAICSSDNDDDGDENTYLISDLTECPVGMQTLHVRLSEYADGGNLPKRTELSASRSSTTTGRRTITNSYDPVECGTRQYCCSKIKTINSTSTAARGENPEDDSVTTDRKYKKKTCGHHNNTASFKIKNAISLNTAANSSSNNNSNNNGSRVSSKNINCIAKEETNRRFQIYPQVPPKPNLPPSPIGSVSSSGRISEIPSSPRRRVTTSAIMDQQDKLYVVANSALSPEEMRKLDSSSSSPKTCRRKRRRRNGSVDLQFLSEDDKSAPEDDGSIEDTTVLESKIVRTVSALLLDSDNETNRIGNCLKDEGNNSTKVSQIVKKFENMCGCNSAVCNKVCKSKCEYIKDNNNNNQQIIICNKSPNNDNVVDSGNRLERKQIIDQLKKKGNAKKNNNGDDNNNNIDISRNFEEFHLDDEEIDVTCAGKIIDSNDIDSRSDNINDIASNSGDQSRNHNVIIDSNNNNDRVEAEGKEAFMSDSSYEKFLESTGLCQKSILTPSRVLSNHRNVVKPKDIKYRSRIKACSNSGGNGHFSQTVKYWTEPYI